MASGAANFHVNIGKFLLLTTESGKCNNSRTASTPKAIPDTTEGRTEQHIQPKGNQKRTGKVQNRSDRPESEKETSESGQRTLAGTKC
jgi:hypothetical protein